MSPKDKPVVVVLIVLAVAVLGVLFARSRFFWVLWLVVGSFLTMHGPTPGPTSLDTPAPPGQTVGAFIEANGVSDVLTPFLALTDLNTTEALISYRLPADNGGILSFRTASGKRIEMEVAQKRICSFLENTPPVPKKATMQDCIKQDAAIEASRKVMTAIGQIDKWKMANVELCNSYNIAYAFWSVGWKRQGSFDHIGMTFSGHSGRLSSFEWFIYHPPPKGTRHNADLGWP